MMERLKEVGGCLLGIIIPICFITLLIFVMSEEEFISDTLLPIMGAIFFIAIGIIVFILGPMGLFRKTRMWSGLGLFIASYIIGVTVWFMSALIVYLYWGWVGLIIGLLIAGIGVLPLAILASMLNGEWALAGIFIFIFALAYGVRLLGAYLMEKAEDEQSSINERNSDMGNLETDNNESSTSEISNLNNDTEIIEDPSVTEKNLTDKYCSQCGGKIVSDESKFCVKCGNKLR